jgi:hypothetical protein
MGWLEKAANQTDGKNMISNERPSPYGRRPQQQYGGAGQGLNQGYGNGQGQGYGPPKQQVPEETIRTERLQVERKTFVLALKENPRGRFLRITEDVNGRRDNVIIPATGLEEFRKLVEEMAKTNTDTPPKLE